MASSRLGELPTALCPGRLAREGRSPLGSEGQKPSGFFFSSGGGGCCVPISLSCVSFPHGGVLETETLRACVHKEGQA